MVSNALTWSSSVRVGGIRLSRNFAVRPDLITYPLLNLSGSAAVPSSVDLFINGYKASSTQINGGPYTLTNVPYISGAGEATIVTTDALGRRSPLACLLCLQHSATPGTQRFRFYPRRVA